MSEENASQNNTEEVVSDESSQTLLGAEHIEEEAKEPSPIYKDKESEKEEVVEEPKEKEAEVDSGTEEKKEDDPEKKEDDTKKEDDPAEEKEAEYSLEAPEESLLGKDDISRIESYAKDNGLGKEAAEKLMNEESEMLSRHDEKLVHDHRETTRGWIDACKADKEIGGEKFDKSTSLATKAIRHFGTDELIAGLNSTGFGNNVELIRVFSRIGNAMSDDNIVKSSMKSGETVEAHDMLYPQKN